MVAPSIRNPRWRLVGAVAIMVATVLAVVALRATGPQAQPAGPDRTDDVTAAAADTAYLRLMIAMDTSALALFVLLQNDSPLLSAAAAQLADSHRTELLELRTLLPEGVTGDDTEVHQGRPGVISRDDLVAVHRAPAANRDTLAIELIYRHLTQGAQLAGGEQQAGQASAVKAMAKRTQRHRVTQLGLLTNLPTALPSPAQS